MKLIIIATLLMLNQSVILPSDSVPTAAPSSDPEEAYLDPHLDALRKDEIRKYVEYLDLRCNARALQDEFHGAICSGDVEKIRALQYTNPILIKIRPRQKRTLLEHAYWYSSYKINVLKELIKLGVNVNEINLSSGYHLTTILSIACCHAPIDTDGLNTAKALLESGANPNLIDHNGRTVLHYAYIYENTELLSLLKKYCADSTTIVDKYGKYPSQYSKVDFNSVGVSTKLHDDFLKAIRACNSEEIKKLHKKDNRLTEIGVSNSESLLTYAYKWTRNKHVIELLLKLGANPNTKPIIGEWDFDYPLITQICIQHDTEMAKLLVQYGANIKYKNLDGTGIIHDLYCNGHTSNSNVVKWLRCMGRKKDIEPKDIFGHEPDFYSYGEKYPSQFMTLYGDPKDKSLRKPKID